MSDETPPPSLRLRPRQKTPGDAPAPPPPGAVPSEMIVAAPQTSLESEAASAASRLRLRPRLAVETPVESTPPPAPHDAPEPGHAPEQPSAVGAPPLPVIKLKVRTPVEPGAMPPPPGAPQASPFVIPPVPPGPATMPEGVSPLSYVAAPDVPGSRPPLVLRPGPPPIPGERPTVNPLPATTRNGQLVPTKKPKPKARSTTSALTPMRALIALLVLVVIGGGLLIWQTNETQTPTPPPPTQTVQPTPKPASPKQEPALAGTPATPANPRPSTEVPPGDVPATTPRAPGSVLARPPQSTPGKIIDKVETMVATRKAEDAARMGEVFGEPVPGAGEPLPPGETTASGGTPPVRSPTATTANTRTATAPANPASTEPKSGTSGPLQIEVVSAITLQKDGTPAPPTAPEIIIPPTDAFRLWMDKVVIKGVFQGNPGRALINGRLARPGDMLDVTSGITFDHIDATTKNLVFRERTGATLKKRY